MKGNVKIKVIKKNEVKSINKMPMPTEKKLEKNATNRIVSTISNWVNEFQEQRIRQANQAIRKFSL
jgi:hypothetical protein